jgi:hypothetical protein
MLLRMKGLGFLLLPLLFSGCDIQPSIEVKAPLDEVWAYMADSGHARDWSVYFDHIRPLGSGDLGIGSIRRCFRRSDEKGISWDERVTEIKPPNLRVLRTYNVQGFHEAIYNTAEYDVFQRFDPLPNGHTKLTLATELVKPRTIKGWWNAILQMREATRIIYFNLDNIAAAIEAQHAHKPYQRVHPFEREQRWD